MIFGEIPVAEAEGLILAHSVRLPKGAFKKGRILSAEDIELLRSGGVTNVSGARLEADDIGEVFRRQRPLARRMPVIVKMMEQQTVRKHDLGHRLSGRQFSADDDEFVAQLVAVDDLLEVADQGRQLVVQDRTVEAVGEQGEGREYLVEVETEHPYRTHLIPMTGKQRPHRFEREQEQMDRRVHGSIDVLGE